MTRVTHDEAAHKIGLRRGSLQAHICAHMLAIDNATLIMSSLLLHYLTAHKWHSTPELLHFHHQIKFQIMPNIDRPLCNLKARQTTSNFQRGAQVCAWALGKTCVYICNLV